MRRLPVLLFLAWICFLFYAGIGIFMNGFLLMRIELSQRSSCLDELVPRTRADGEVSDSCWMDRRFRRAVIILVDALQYEFARFDPTNLNPKPYENRLQFIHQLISSQPHHARLYPFKADPPTTTMQRIKGITTGSLPTFIDMSNNFASNAIMEDNLIDQLVQNGKRVVFMGDDTWDGLFPKKFFKSFFFPSFNVKDLHTVDNGILQHLFPTVNGSEWDVLIAHFLGVDHCGHKHGPDHPETAKKLSQMNEVIRSLVDYLHNDTLLVVIGDHGMTDTGDHGGDTEKEVTTALFIYSKTALFRDGLQEEPDAVPQVNLVPTLALLLGIPVPYSNIGEVMADVFSWNDANRDSSGSVTQALAYQINARQVNRFMNAYSQAAEDLPVEKLRHLQELFSSAANGYDQLMAEMQEKPGSILNLEALLQQQTSNLQHYLREARAVCTASWARFHPLRMVAGVAIIAATCLLCWVISELPMAFEFPYRSLLLSPVVWGLSLAAFLSFWRWVITKETELVLICSWAAAISQLSFLWQVWKMRLKRNFVLGSRWLRRSLGLKQRLLMVLKWVLPMIVLFFRCCTMFSDSFLLAESRVVPFLLQSLSILMLVKLHWSGKLLMPGWITSGLLVESHKPSPVPTYRRESLHLLGLLVSFQLCVLFSALFHSCRDEIPGCEPSPFLTPLSSLQDVQIKNLSYGLCVASLVAIIYLTRCWLRHYGNLNSSSPLMLFVRWGFPLIAVWISCYWAISSGMEDNMAKFKEVIQVALVACPRAVYGLVALGLLVALWSPMTVFVQDSREFKTHIVTAYQGIPNSEADLRHVIPQIYRKMQRSLKSRLGGADEHDKATVAAFGLGSVYSAALVIILLLLIFFFLLLHSEGMSLAFLLLLVEGFILLQLHGCAVKVSVASDGSEHFLVSWDAVTAWAFASTQFFYSTGHQPILSAIHWNTAFVGFVGDHSTNLLPAFLVGANTFASHVLFAVGCPLLLFWPFLGESSSSRKRKVKKDWREGEAEGELPVMEMRLRECPEKFSAALLQLALKYLFVLGIQLLACVFAALILRRHLMVWKVFAPKFLFEALGFVVSSSSLLVGIALVMRVDCAVSTWFKKLILSRSR
nr:GPI ethanolamine phosphate transferase 3 isoform X2 [Geotrypetes seraphini]XP_033792141.1 GPI ethanolamine phosphate transferase 3 isoform X2 [Geotrypetes seraphini]XP_033792147.1 GPI ethanolamine phosphate transferase 3 isoform X2 [Geotrypetes seraphini]XP_033792156.1 GPI ethanolamine phosphate transferase 3 isoform X2 [Geotrypetes seraphini]